MTVETTTFDFSPLVPGAEVVRTAARRHPVVRMFEWLIVFAITTVLGCVAIVLVVLSICLQVAPILGAVLAAGSDRA